MRCENWKCFSKFLPSRLSRSSMPTTVVGKLPYMKFSLFVQVTPNLTPIVDRHPQYPNVIVGGAFSGKCSPGIINNYNTRFFNGF